MHVTFIKEFLKEINYLSSEKYQINTLKSTENGRDECLRGFTHYWSASTSQETNPNILLTLPFLEIMHLDMWFDFALSRHNKIQDLLGKPIWFFTTDFSLPSFSHSCRKFLTQLRWQLLECIKLLRIGYQPYNESVCFKNNIPYQDKY